MMVSFKMNCVAELKMERASNLKSGQKCLQEVILEDCFSRIALHSGNTLQFHHEKHSSLTFGYVV